MKHKNKILIVMTTVVITISGCVATFQGTATDSASLQQKNFKIVKNIKGSSTATYILGFGGQKHSALFAEAKKNMLDSNPLQDNQTIANMTADIKTNVGLFTIKVTATTTADVIEFTK